MPLIDEKDSDYISREYNIISTYYCVMIFLSGQEINRDFPF